MSKTVKEIADELGVSRQYIQKIISELPATKKPTKVKHSYSIDNEIELYIKGIVGKTDNQIDNSKTTEADKATEELSKKYEQSLLESITNLRKQIDQRDKQLCDMQKLLDQSQQLQLMAENKIKQLENKDNKSDSEDADKKKTEPNKKGFWNNLFS